MMKNILVVGGSNARTHEIVRNFKEKGHHVEEAAVERSIDILQEREEIDLVIMGVSSSDGSARSLAEMVKESGIRLFLMTDGFARQDSVDDAASFRSALDGGDNAIRISGPRLRHAGMKRISAA